MNKYLNKNVQALNLKSGAMFKFHKDEENESVSLAGTGKLCEI